MTIPRRKSTLIVKIISITDLNIGRRGLFRSRNADFKDLSLAVATSVVNEQPSSLQEQKEDGESRKLATNHRRRKIQPWRDGEIAYPSLPLDELGSCELEDGRCTFTFEQEIDEGDGDVGVALDIAIVRNLKEVSGKVQASSHEEVICSSRINIDVRPGDDVDKSSTIEMDFLLHDGFSDRSSNAFGTIPEQDEHIQDKKFKVAGRLKLNYYYFLQEDVKREESPVLCSPRRVSFAQNSSPYIVPSLQVRQVQTQSTFSLKFKPIFTFIGFLGVFVFALTVALDVAMSPGNISLLTLRQKYSIIDFTASSLESYLGDEQINNLFHQKIVFVENQARSACALLRNYFSQDKINIVKVDENSKLHIELGLSLLESDPSGAETVCSLYPNDIASRSCAAEARLKLYTKALTSPLTVDTQRLNLAHEEFYQLTKQDPTNMEARSGYGLALLLFALSPKQTLEEKSKLIFESSLHLSAAMSHNNDNFAVVWNAALAQAHMKRFKVVVEYLQSVNITKRDARTLSNIGTALVNSGELLKGTDALNRAAEVYCKHDYHYSKGKDLSHACSTIYSNLAVALEISNLEKSLKDFCKPNTILQTYNQALSWNPRNSFAKSNLDQYIEKSEAFCEDISIEKKDLTVIAFDEFEKKTKKSSMPAEVQKAIETFENALALNPSNAKLWIGLARARSRAGDYSRALDASIKAVDTASKDDELDVATKILEEYLDRAMETDEELNFEMQDNGSPSSALDMKALRLELEIQSLKLQLLQQTLESQGLEQKQIRITNEELQSLKLQLLQQTVEIQGLEHGQKDISNEAEDDVSVGEVGVLEVSSTKSSTSTNPIVIETQMPPSFLLSETRIDEQAHESINYEKEAATANSANEQESNHEASGDVRVPKSLGTFIEDTSDSEVIDLDTAIQSEEALGNDS